MDRQTDKWIDRLMEEQIDRQMNRQMDRQLYIVTYMYIVERYMYGQIEGLIDKWLDR